MQIIRAAIANGMNSMKALKRCRGNTCSTKRTFLGVVKEKLRV
ncbi:MULTISPECIES: hypothetical protein [Cyanophyceae]|nr:hypothetical protein [Trichocoleus sp. FACHB-40]